MAKNQLTKGLVTGRTSSTISQGVNTAISGGLKNTEAKEGLAAHASKGVVKKGTQKVPAQPTGQATGSTVSGSQSLGGGGI